MKAIIIGRGPSCLKCTKPFVDSHDFIAVVNHFIFEGYEQYVGSHADVQFRNASLIFFTREQFAKLGIKKIVFTQRHKENPRLPRYYKGVAIERAGPWGKRIISQLVHPLELNASSGSIGLVYLLNNYELDELSIVGFDLYEVGQMPYYFDPKRAEYAVKKLYTRTYKGNRVNEPSGHDTQLTAIFMHRLFEEYDDVQFNIITESRLLKSFDLSNVKLL